MDPPDYTSTSIPVVGSENFHAVVDAHFNAKYWESPLDPLAISEGVALNEAELPKAASDYETNWSWKARIDAVIDAHPSEHSAIPSPNSWQPETSIFDSLDLPPIDTGCQLSNVRDQNGSNNFWNETSVQEDASTLEPNGNYFGTYKGDFLEPGFSYDLPMRYHQDQPENSVYEDQYPWAGNILIPVPFVSNQAFATEENGHR